MSDLGSNMNKELRSYIKDLADKHLGNPWYAEINISDDGTFTVRIYKTLNSRNKPKTPPENYPYDEWDPDSYNWKKRVSFDWKSNRAKVSLTFNNDGREFQYKYIDTIDISDLDDRILEDMQSRETTVETSEGKIVDYTKRKKGSFRISDNKKEQSIKSEDTQEPMQTDEVSQLFTKAFDIWKEYLHDIFALNYEERGRTYDLDRENFHIEDNIVEIDRILDDLNRVTKFGSHIVKNHNHKLSKLRALYRQIKKNIRLVGDEFKKNWNKFVQYMDRMFNVLGEKNDAWY